MVKCKIALRRATALFIIFYLLLIQNGPAVLAAIPETVGTGPGAKQLVTCDDAGDIIRIDAAGINGLGFYCLVSMSYKLFFSILSLLGIGAFVMLMIGGLKYITSGGDGKSLMSAKKTITYGALGMGTAVVSIFLFIVLNDVILQPGGGFSPFRLGIPDWVCTQYGKDIAAGICGNK